MMALAAFRWLPRTMNEADVLEERSELLHIQEETAEEPGVETANIQDLTAEEPEAETAEALVLRLERSNEALQAMMLALHQTTAAQNEVLRSLDEERRLEMAAVNTQLAQLQKQLLKQKEKQKQRQALKERRRSLRCKPYDRARFAAGQQQALAKEGN